ncbi:hypothetical protein FRX31_022868 [Thalictrum thalictroides]|uniref:Uncharacterized protein n=1 Tax=Thalictrum thalictroides TaxID=46969 RepID=A0A7J6VS44_THATH|nr:hypothetical protein FRX31_022868 [Thalictrum thalictroides]
MGCECFDLIFALSACMMALSLFHVVMEYVGMKASILLCVHTTKYSLITHFSLFALFQFVLCLLAFSK